MDIANHPLLNKISDNALSEMTGVPRHRINIVRRELGLPSYKEQKRIDVLNDPEFETAQTSVLARRHGVSLSMIKRLRAKMDVDDERYRVKTYEIGEIAQLFKACDWAGYRI